MEFWLLHLITKPSESEAIELNQQLIMEVAAIFEPKYLVQYVAVTTARMSQD